MSTEPIKTANIEPEKEDYSKYELLADVYDPEVGYVDAEEFNRVIENSLESMLEWTQGKDHLRVTRFVDGEPVVSYETRQESEEWEDQQQEQEHQADTAA